MILCIDVGNTHIVCGVFINKKIKLKFRYPTHPYCTSDQFGVFLKNTLRENNMDTKSIESIIICSVVPSVNYSINAACIKYFNIVPLELRSGLKTGLKLNIKNPLGLGADRVANAVAALHNFPNKNIILIDFGTATTLCCISKNKEYLGGSILPGYKISMESLHKNTAKLMPVSIKKPEKALGRSTEENIQSGLYYCQLGAVKELIAHFLDIVFNKSKPIIIATGGYAYLFKEENLFTVTEPDLTLHGLLIIQNKNNDSKS
ncbi:MAG: type III pantothenate kinase [Rickettsiales bacterium]|nr:type III pantothenate kinase [Rickettsiales bacterium]